MITPVTSHTVSSGRVLLAPHWVHLSGVRSPGPAAQVLEVVVGPSGVHVILEQPTATDDGAPDGLHVAVRAAQVGAREVAAGLPQRYRGCVSAAVRVGGTDGHGVQVLDVTVASTAALTDSMRFRPRVLSTSEVTIVAAHLRGVLPLTTPPASARRRSWSAARSRLVRYTAAAAATAAVGEVALRHGVPGLTR